MFSKVVKTTSKGQITLPMQWRNQFNTDNYLIKADKKYIIITPIKIKNLEAEEVIFDSDRDNDGKGVSVDEMIKMLKKIK